MNSQVANDANRIEYHIKPAEELQRSKAPHTNDPNLNGNTHRTINQNGNQKQIYDEDEDIILASFATVSSFRQQYT